MPFQSKRYDVLVLGGGNAGLSAAIAARQSGASVLLLEQAPRELRGGNSRHARNLRIMHETPNLYMRTTYSADEYLRDIVTGTSGSTDETLARVLIDESADAIPWMERCGVRFVSALPGTEPRSRKTVFLLGGGKALLNAYYRKAEKLGIEVWYDSKVVSIEFENKAVAEVRTIVNGSPTRIQTKSIVASAGGFQSNISWLRRHWGEAADRFLVRGTPYAQGEVLQSLFDHGAAPAGDPAQCHFVAVDGRAPKFDSGIASRVYCTPFGIVVDRSGRRFHDEGEVIGSERYAAWGGLVARCPGQLAHSIFDAKVEGLFRPSAYPPIRAPSIEELAEKIGLDPRTLGATVRAFNDATRCTTRGSIHPKHCRTEGVRPPKTHWALPIDAPPYGSYPLRPGITFNYLGVKTDQNARVLMADGRPSRNVFAAGLIMASNVLGQGYLAGIGMTIGTVFGRIAGREAAHYANH